jgi:nucleoside phosphorylase
VLSLPFDWQQESVSGDDSLYWSWSITGTHKNIRVVASSAARMGMPAATVSASKMISQYRPKLLVMCGIMAGVEGKARLGDIVVPTTCWDWGNGKWTLSKDGEHVFLPAPHQIGLSPTVRERLKIFSADNLLFAGAYEQWKGAKPSEIPVLRLGPVASGAAVLADKVTRERLVGEHRELLGIEMELYGVSVAAEEAVMPRPLVVGMKAVVDFADGGKSDGYQEYGSYMSAQALRTLVPSLCEAIEARTPGAGT